MNEIRTRIGQLEELGWGVKEIAELLEELKNVIHNGDISKITTRKTTNDFISDLMEELGIGYGFCGTPYLREILKTMLEIGTTMEIKNINLSKDIYPRVAAKFNVNIGCIERNIRTVKGHAKVHNKELMHEIFGIYADDDTKLKNKIFILGLYEYVRKNC